MKVDERQCEIIAGNACHLKKYCYLYVFITSKLTRMETIVKNEDLLEQEWPVRPYYKRELAIAYAPDIAPVSALNRLAKWFKTNETLSTALQQTGYNPRQQVFTSMQVELIFRYLGRP